MQMTDQKELAEYIANILKQIQGMFKKTYIIYMDSYCYYCMSLKILLIMQNGIYYNFRMREE